MRLPSYLVEKVEETVRAKLSPEALDHALRVRQRALQIGRAEGLDEEGLEIAEISALMHNLAYSDDAAWADSATASSRLARDVLATLDVPVSRAERACHCIASHSFSSGVEPGSAEARVVFDANAIELLGPVGIIRLCSCVKPHEEKTVASLAHKLRAFGQRYYSCLRTKSGREIAAGYWKFELEFLDRLDSQLAGK